MPSRLDYVKVYPRVETMEVISLVLSVLKFVGASPSLAQYKSYRFYGFFILLVMTTNLYAYILAFIINSTDASLFLQTFSMSMGAFSAIAKATTLIFAHQTFETILNGIHNFLGERELYSMQYQKYNKTEKNYSRLYGIFMLMSAQTISFGPLMTVLFGAFNGVVNFRYPCEVVYLLREETLYEYIVFFLYSALNIQLNAAFLFVADAGFFGIILYLLAAFENLADDFRDIETIDASNKYQTQKEKFVNCIYFHRKLLSLADELENLYSPIIFFQFFMSCLQICAITLELLLHEHITWDRFVQVLPVYPTILAILFIYCNFGNELSVKAGEISDAIYNSKWYCYPLSLQKMTPYVIQRAQQPVTISGFKLFACTLENYSKALNKVASMMTIMRQLLNK